MAVLMVGLRVGDRVLPLAWRGQAGSSAHIGFVGQCLVLEKILRWLPTEVTALLSADRFYPSVALFNWLQGHGVLPPAVEEQPLG